MLEGSLETFPLSSVVKLLDDAGQTGKLSVHAALGQGSLTFEHGRLVNASGPGTDALEAALALFEYSTGTFTFRVEPPGDSELDVDISQFLDLVAERETMWTHIREVIPQDAPLVVVPLEVSDRPGGDVTVSSEAWKVAVIANGRTPAQLASLVGTTEFRACSILLELHEGGLVGFNAASTAQRPSKAAPPPVHEVLDEVVDEEPEPDQDGDGVDPELDPEMLLRELGESPQAPTTPASRRRLTRR